MYICSRFLEWNQTLDEQKAMFPNDVFSFQSCLGFVDNASNILTTFSLSADITSTGPN